MTCVSVCIVHEGSKCEISRRGFAFKGIVASGVSVIGSSLVTEPGQGQFYYLRWNDLIDLCFFFLPLGVELSVFLLLLLFFFSGLERLPYKPEGYNYWTWKGHKIHYVVQGEGFPIVLIHGFGASAFHWRFALLYHSSNWYILLHSKGFSIDNCPLAAKFMKLGDYAAAACELL